MNKVFPLLVVGLMLLTFASCERVGEPSPIKGVWEYEDKYFSMTFKFGEKEVEYTQNYDYYGGQAIYFGTYTINDNIITLNFNSIKSKKTTQPKIIYEEPEDMPKEAIIKDSTTISYLDCIFKRKK